MSTLRTGLLAGALLAGGLAPAAPPNGGGPAEPVNPPGDRTPGEAPPCPADDPVCLPNNPAAPAGSTRREEGPVVPVPQQDGAPGSEEGLVRRVRERLLTGRPLPLDGVTVQSALGRVRLRGRVRSEEDRAELVRRAAEAAGRDRVIDELVVSP